jgi:hypothetical protein
MKQILKHSINLLLLLGFVIIVSSCNKTDNIVLVNPDSAPSATAISPSSGYPGSNVTISGSGFGTYSGIVKVFFAGIPSTAIVSITDNQIVATVPARALSGNVGLQIWTGSANPIGKFTVLLPPSITSVISRGMATTIAQPGDTVYISGKNFPTDASKIAVDFNGTAASTITSLTSTLIKVLAPVGYTSGNVNITLNGNFKVAGKPLSPDIPTGDVSMFFLKNYKQPFTGIVAGDASRWRTPSDWTVTAPVMNHNGANNAPAGGLDNNHPPIYIGVEAGWGAAAIVDGKMYQTATLPAGIYTYSAGMTNNGFSNTNNYIVAATGTTIPEAANITTALGSANIVSDNTYYNSVLGKTFSFNFTLTQPTKVSLGFLFNFGSGGEYLNFLWVKLERK